MNEVFPFDISDIVFLLNLKIRRKNQTSWDCDCPFCGKEGKLNINLEKAEASSSYIARYMVWIGLRPVNRLRIIWEKASRLRNMRALRKR